MKTFLALLATAALSQFAVAQQARYSHGNPTQLEQKMLELINRARINPTREGVILDSLNTDYSRLARQQAPSFFTNLRAQFAALPAVQPLAFNPALLQAARTHSQDMVDRNYMAHVNPEGLNPTGRATAAGYTAQAGENIAGAGATNSGDVARIHFDLMVDHNNIDPSHPFGHRLNVLDGDFSEVGVGIRGTFANGKATQDFGTATRSFIVGVAFRDLNGNGAYDLGEGLAGVTVRPATGNWFAVTSASGGFAIPVDPVQTVNETVNIPVPVQTTSFNVIQAYDKAFRKQKIQSTPSLTVALTWSGGPLAAPVVNNVVIKRPVQVNYKLKGTDGFAYSFTMLTSANAKKDLVVAP